MIALRLKEVAEAKKINRHQISMQTGISYPTIQKYWLNEATTYDATILNKLCNLLECGIADLIEFEPDTQVKSTDHITLTESVSVKVD